jgi:hypothetical protein
MQKVLFLARYVRTLYGFHSWMDCARSCLPRLPFCASRAALSLDNSRLCLSNAFDYIRRCGQAPLWLNISNDACSHTLTPVSSTHTSARWARETLLPDVCIRGTSVIDAWALDPTTFSDKTFPSLMHLVIELNENKTYVLHLRRDVCQLSPALATSIFIHVVHSFQPNAFHHLKLARSEDLNYALPLPCQFLETLSCCRKLWTLFPRRWFPAIGRSSQKNLIFSHLFSFRLVDTSGPCSAL